MSSSARLVYKVLGGLFMLIGAYTLLNAGIAWEGARTVLWAPLGYAVLDFAMGYGLWNRRAWILTALALNFAGIAVLVALRLGGSPASLLSFSGLLADGLLFWYAYATRRGLEGGRREKAGVLFYAAWVLIIGYNMYIALW